MRSNGKVWPVIIICVRCAHTGGQRIPLKWKFFGKVKFVSRTTVARWNSFVCGFTGGPKWKQKQSFFWKSIHSNSMFLLFWKPTAYVNNCIWINDSIWILIRRPIAVVSVIINFEMIISSTSWYMVLTIAPCAAIIITHVRSRSYIHKLTVNSCSWCHRWFWKHSVSFFEFIPIGFGNSFPISVPTMNYVSMWSARQVRLFQ